MNFVSMIFGWNGGSSIGTLPLDALVNEKTTLTSRVTSFAVEDGPPVTDHVVADSEQLTLDGWVTAADISLLGGLRGAALGAGRSKLIGAKDALRKIHADRLPITITTGLDVYADFVMESCSIGRSNGAGDRFELSASFKRIRKVTLRQADIPPEKTSGSATGKAGSTKANAGKQNGVPASQKQRDTFNSSGILST
ncbi:phage baseplate protein [Achromobacter spanius]|uniref:phage baseplate protein n=1 Tax=Achromobacter spanius TaxID=217203 RepID=UPI0036E6BB3B